MQSTKFKLLDIKMITEYEGKIFEQVLLVEFNKHQIFIVDSIIGLGCTDIGKSFQMNVEIRLLNPSKSDEYDLPEFFLKKIANDIVVIDETIFSINPSNLSLFKTNEFKAKVNLFIYRGLIKKAESSRLNKLG